MKIKAFFLSAFFLGMFCCLPQPGSLFAQKAQSKTTAKDVKPGTLISYCDEVLSVRKKELQTKANASCQTVSSCETCFDRKLNMNICAYMVLQPDKSSKCNPVVVDEVASMDMEATDAAERASGRASGRANNRANNRTDESDDKPAPLPFQLEILQSTCIKSGTTLEVMVPGVDFTCDRTQYTFLWEKDGQKAGHNSKIECVCGKEATVRVTQTSTGATMWKTVKLNTCDSKD